MSDPNIFQEIQADIDRQKWEDLWKRYGVLVITCALAIILGTAAMSAWRSWKADKEQGATTGLITVINQPGDDPAKTAALEDFAKKNQGMSQAVFAQLQAAAIAAKDGKTDDAVKLYDSIASDSKTDTVFRQFADLMSVKIQMDNGDPAKLSERLKPLTEDNGAWRFSAKEYQGYLALKAGDKKKAREIFASLSRDATAPQTLSARAGDMLHSLAE